MPAGSVGAPHLADAAGGADEAERADDEVPVDPEEPFDGSPRAGPAALCASRPQQVLSKAVRTGPAV